MMMRLLRGLTSLCLLLLAAGCATSPPPRPLPPEAICQIPLHLVAPLPAPKREVQRNLDMLQLLADYDSLRRRANADRAAIVEIMAHDAGDED
ncbi:hypothetical protein EQG41_20935 [Billgrantia azerbaijanica]|nr:hypothetical protein EQG41_20935 [Halomonas azerbaijanica]